MLGGKLIHDQNILKWYTITLSFTSVPFVKEFIYIILIINFTLTENFQSCFTMK